MTLKKSAHQPTISQKKIKAILDYIRIGSHVETAATAAGITRAALHVWLKRGAKARDLIDKGEEVPKAELPFLRFSEQMQVAVSESEILDLERVDKAGDLQWQAAAWKLERRFPDRYALRQRVTQENLNVDLSTLSNEQLLRVYNGEPLSTVLSQPTPTPE